MSEAIHTTTVVSPGALDVGIRVETHKEAVGEKWFLYYQVITWLGFDKNMQGVGEKVYLEGKLKDLEQVIKLELTEEAINEVSEKYHEAAVLWAETYKDAYKYQFFAAIARSM